MKYAISLDVSHLHPNVLASAGEDGVKLWDLITLQFLTDVRGGCCNQVRWHPTAPQTLLTCGLADRALTLHRFQQQQNAIFFTNDADFEQVEWLDDLVVFTDEKGAIGLVDPQQGKLLQKLQLFTDYKKAPLTALAIHCSQKLILAASPEVPKVCIIRVDNANLQVIDYYDYKPAFSAVFLPDEDAFGCIIGHGDGCVSLFQVYSRIGPDAIKDIVKDPQEYMQMRDIELFIEGFDKDEDIE